MGDAAANLVWRGAMFFLAVFYTDTFGLDAMAVGALMLIVRMSDGVTDIIMGMIADRTQTRWGKFRPWVLFSAPILGVFMVLTYTTPDLSPTMKLVYAYVTYIGLTLAYTMNNVPYSALMGVMTPSNVERTKLSGWRFAGAFLGGFIISVGTPVLLSLFGNGDDKAGYQSTMYVFAGLLVFLLLITFLSTRERVTPPPQQKTEGKTDWLNFSKNMLLASIPLISMTLFFYFRNWQSGLFFLAVIIVTIIVIRRLINTPRDALSDAQLDIVDLLTNIPWVILLGIGFLFMMFTGIKSAATAYYFFHFLDDNMTLASTFSWAPEWLANINAQNALLSAYLGGTMVISVFGALATGFLIRFIGKRELFIATLLIGAALSCAIFLLGPEDVGTLFVLGIGAEFFVAMWPVLFFSMLGDSADYSEWKHQRRATGLVFSAGTFINKTGGGFAGALVVMVLAAYGYVGTDASTISLALPAMKALMSWIPALFAVVGAVLMLFYPLSSGRMAEIESTLLQRRASGS